MRRVSVCNEKQRCIRCQTLKPLGDFHRSNQYVHDRRTTCKSCRHTEAAAFFLANKTTLLEKARLAVRRRKRECLNQYGASCICCGEEILDFLSLDHINDDGSADKRGYPFYVLLKKLGYPRKDELQTLCMNCQLGKRINKGFCPHHPDVDLRLPRKGLCQ